MEKYVHQTVVLMGNVVRRSVPVVVCVVRTINFVL